MNSQSASDIHPPTKVMRPSESTYFDYKDTLKERRKFEPTVVKTATEFKKLIEDMQYHSTHSLTVHSVELPPGYTMHDKRLAECKEFEILSMQTISRGENYSPYTGITTTIVDVDRGMLPPNSCYTKEDVQRYQVIGDEYVRVAEYNGSIVRQNGKKPVKLIPDAIATEAADNSGWLSKTMKWFGGN